ncbi:hypothetical protein GJ689_07720 [Rhodoplanes serenus]|uniref:Helix-turn-helix domain-containing protein n=1 Tax=Rhodoplanes serenus TaxID=200615 RepID=A0A9X4XM56_9BRAD|nr:hypothetical protein [Rhodoplanes serenus]MTW16094.1 hypothetical protein [Rhodoplanes serenus]
MGGVAILPRDRLAWIRQMAEDRELSHVAFRVAVLIGGYFNSKTGKTHVGLQRVADDLGIGRATVARALDELSDRPERPRRRAGRGHLRITSGGGRHLANEYQMILKTVSQVRPFCEPETVSNRAGNSLTRETPTLTSPSEKNSTRAPTRARGPRTAEHDAPPKVGDREGAVGIEIKPGTPEFAALLLHFEATGQGGKASLMRAAELQRRSYFARSEWVAAALPRPPLRVVASATGPPGGGSKV